MRQLNLGRYELHPIGTLQEEAQREHKSSASAVVRVENLRKVFRSGLSQLVLFDDLSFTVEAGELLAIVGESGAGKSTLLHILGVLDTPSGGKVYCDQRPMDGLSDDAAADFRNREIGFVWQFHYLLPEFTAQENVAMPLLMRRFDRASAMDEAGKWLQQVGLAGRAQHRAGELSGGEQQRVAIARALVTAPRLFIADEPTGDLDNRTAEMVFELIARLHREHKLTSLVATHNIGFARRCDRVLKLHQGKMEEVSPASLEG